MGRERTKFVCQECGAETTKWMGRCPGCGQWSTLVEEKERSSLKGTGQRDAALGCSRPVPLNQVEVEMEERFRTGLQEVDRVLGGGIVPGSLVLVGGDPGIGKSTLLLQVCQAVSKDLGTVLYVSGEESEKQTKLRAERLGVNSANLYVYAETSLSAIEEEIERLNPFLVVIDSIQTMYSDLLESAPGSVSQVRECTARLMRLGKSRETTIFIVGHVTKEGAIAGPRVLEHMVDTVLYFEGERHHAFRILRGVKNRFGSTNEIGIFEMRDRGLIEVANPSEIFLTQRRGPVSGSVVVASLEGTRPVLAEIQALVTPSGYGVPRRTTSGVDYNRVALVMAVLEKRIGLGLSNHDAYVNVVGGIRLDEPAVDLALALAIVSSYRDLGLPGDMAVAGEIGLTGEVRPVNRMEQRAKEAAKLGFRKMVIPRANLSGIESTAGIQIIGAETLEEVLEAVF